MEGRTVVLACAPMSQAPWPVSLTVLGPADAGAVVWRMRGQLNVTIAVKSIFLLAPGGLMTPAQPEPMLRAEAHHQNNPMKSVRATGDLSPYLGRADVVMTGHARAPRGKPAPVIAVRLAVYRGQPLLDKTLHVYGDRAARSDPKPFEEMPLVYERAIGGVGWDHNPLGVGVQSNAVVNATTANVVNPADPLA